MAHWTPIDGFRSDFDRSSIVFRLVFGRFSVGFRSYSVWFSNGFRSDLDRLVFDLFRSDFDRPLNIYRSPIDRISIVHRSYSDRSSIGFRWDFDRILMGFRMDFDRTWISWTSIYLRSDFDGPLNDYRSPINQITFGRRSDFAIGLRSNLYGILLYPSENKLMLTTVDICSYKKKTEENWRIQKVTAEKCRNGDKDNSDLQFLSVFFSLYQFSTVFYSYMQL